MTIKAVKHRFELSAAWVDRDDANIGVATIDVDAKEPYAAYDFEGFDTMTRLMSRRSAEQILRCMRSWVAFQDATGAKPSRAYERFFSEGEPMGFDHTRVWRLDKGYLITTEPYEGRHTMAAASCLELGWGHVVLPPGIGMWNPAQRAGTRLIIVAPQQTAVDLVAVETAVQQAFCGPLSGASHFR